MIPVTDKSGKRCKDHIKDLLMILFPFQGLLITLASRFSSRWIRSNDKKFITLHAGHDQHETCSLFFRISSFFSFITLRKFRKIHYYLREFDYLLKLITRGQTDIKGYIFISLSHLQVKTLSARFIYKSTIPLTTLLSWFQLIKRLAHAVNSCPSKQDH